jgi:RNA polymerase sigma-70 factor (ECF subfamily)
MKGPYDPTWNFDQIYQNTFPILIKILSKMLGDAEVAEELCHEAFIKLYERGNGIPTGEEAKYWLIRVAKNLALNYEKRRGREKRAYHKALHEPIKPAESGESEYLKKESSLLVLGALKKLPANLREVLILKEYGDLNYREIAAVLKISEGNVKVRVYRARERLADCLRDMGGMYVP